MHVFRISSGRSFPKIVLFFQKKVIFSTHTFLKSIFMRLGPKPILGFRVLLLLENRGPSYKGYKIWCLQMPIFWFVSSTNEIKRIRDKTFCLDVHDKQYAYIGRVQLRRVMWDSYIWSSMGVTGETSNDMFTIQEPGLPIASKRWVTGVLSQATKIKPILLKIHVVMWVRIVPMESI